MDEYEEQIKQLQRQLESKDILQDLIFLEAKTAVRQEMMAEHQQRLEEICLQAEQDEERRAYHVRVQQSEMAEAGYEWGGSDEDSNGECGSEGGRGFFSPRSPLSHPPDTPMDEVLYSPSRQPWSDYGEHGGDGDVIGGDQTMYSPSQSPRHDDNNDMDASNDETVVAAASTPAEEQASAALSPPSPLPSALSPSGLQPSPSAGQQMDVVPETPEDFPGLDVDSTLQSLHSNLHSALQHLDNMQALPPLASLTSRPQPTAPQPTAPHPTAPPAPDDAGLPSFEQGGHLLDAETDILVPQALIPPTMTAIVATPENQRSTAPPTMQTIDYFTISDSPPTTPRFGSPLLPSSPAQSSSPAQTYLSFQPDSAHQMDSPRTASPPNSDMSDGDYQPDSDARVMSDTSAYNSSDAYDSEDEDLQRSVARVQPTLQAANQPSPVSVRVTRNRARLANQAASALAVRGGMAGMGSDPVSGPVSPQASNIIHALLSPNHLNEADRQIFDYCAFSDRGMQHIKNQSAPMRLAFNFDEISVDHTEFRSLKVENRWLSDGVIKAYSKIIMLRNDRLANDSLNRVVIVDPLFSVRILQPDPNNHRGLIPWVKRLMTKETSSFAFPTYVTTEKHWYPVFVDIKDCKIRSVESLDRDHTHLVNCIKGFFDLYWSAICGGRRHRSWDVKQLMPPMSPEQTDDFNCGVFTCVVMDLYCVGIKFGNMKRLVNRRNITDIRKRMTLFMEGFNYR